MKTGTRKGIPNRRFCTSFKGDIIARLEKVAKEWMEDPDVEAQREGFKVIAPYFLPRLTAMAVSGDKENPLEIHFDSDDKNL